MPLTVTGEVERVTFENEATGFRVLRLGSLGGELRRREPLVVVGTLPAVGPGMQVRVSGELVVDARFGEQLKAESLVPIDPKTLPGIERHLASGVLPGIGPGLAARIVGHFGLKTLEVLDQTPARLAEVGGISRKRAKELAVVWADQRGLSNLMVLLHTHGVSPALGRRILERYGPRAAAVVERTPYRLALEVRGVGFRTADAIASSLGVAGDHPDRVQAGVLHALGELADQGHVVVERAVLVEKSCALLGVDRANVEVGLDAAWAAGHVVIEPGAGVGGTAAGVGAADDGVYLAQHHEAERRVAEALGRLIAAPARALPGLEGALAAFEREAGVELAPRQRDAVRAAAERKVVVITGGPGTGKTTIVRAVLAVLEGARLTARLCAPTGRAAKRLAETTGREALTIHRLLEFEPKAATFARHEDNPLQGDALIVDETSMVDLPLAAALLGALPTEARLVVVGDVDQLPSVGPGSVLRDLIDSGAVPTVRLDEVFRQAARSGIVRNAHRIHQGEVPVSDPRDAPTADFFVVERTEPEAVAELVAEFATRRLPAHYGLDPRRDVQVLTPMHRGETGTMALNQRLQAALTGAAPGLPLRGQEVRVGDRVMQTRNDYEREVFNGDLGVVERLDGAARKLEVRFDARLVEYQGDDLDALLLAWATSIHKSQGSEYPAVVLPLVTQHFVMLSRNLLYTAVTRARRICVVVAHPRALRLAVDQARVEARGSRLAQRLVAALGA